MSNELENGNVLMLDFDKLVKAAGCGVPVMPVGVQDADTKELLIIAYANEEALENTIKTGNATFWSTSRNELWEKGATSGDVLKIVEIRVNCEQNSLLYIVRPERKGACHTKNEQGETRKSCYYRNLISGKNQILELGFV
ncbi:phosphoribosyl-AMP cyclohydrolase [bacterium]|nr:phosphoribosyl-AMP cyclohydrolase [bacterium]